MAGEQLKRLDEARANIKLAQEKQKEVYDHKHANPKAYQVGSKVLKKDFMCMKRKGGKMDAKYVGPFVITKSLGKGLYALQSAENPGHVIDRVNGVHLKPYLTPPPSPSQDPNHSHLSDLPDSSFLSDHDLCQDTISPLPPPMPTLSQLDQARNCAQPEFLSNKTISVTGCTSSAPVTEGGFYPDFFQDLSPHNHPSPIPVKPPLKPPTPTLKPPTSPMKPIKPPSKSTKPSSKPTRQPLKPTKPPSKPTKPPSKPTKPPLKPKPRPMSKAAKMMLSRRQNRTKEHASKDDSIIDADAYEPKNPAKEERPWIPDLGLSERDRFTLLSPTAWLNDEIINAAQKLLKAQSRDVLGFQSVACGLTMNFNVEAGEFIQILHAEGHWLTISTIGTVHPEIIVYDSLYSTLPTLAKAQIASLLATQQPSIKVKFMDVQMQLGSSDCGLFAIAYATALSFGLPPGKFLFKQSEMRSHLQNCLEDKKMAMFPFRRTRRTASAKVKSTSEFQVYCTCRMPDLPETHWIQCSQCSEWFHVQSCVVVPKEALDKEVIWCCNCCKS